MSQEAFLAEAEPPASVVSVVSGSELAESEAESLCPPDFLAPPRALRRGSSDLLTPISLCQFCLAGRSRGCSPPQFAPWRVAPTEGLEGPRLSKAELSRQKSLKAIEDQKKLCGHRRDIDVLELFLSRKELVDVIDLAKFRKLKHLWLSFNKLQDIRFLLRNPCLAELYLDNNSLYSIEGLRHLVSLNVLMLHNNQLRNLDAVVDELKLMNNLKTLNLYQNPLSQDEKHYRISVIYHLPSVWLLDRKEITLKERRVAFHMFNHERSSVAQSLAFGRRADKALYLLPLKSGVTVSQEPVMSQRFNQNLFHNKEDAVFVRSLKRSVTKFSFVDWDTVPTRVERCLEGKDERPVEWATVRIR
ncbi:leucine-rich repeat-containing protein 72 [Macrotis lagotis]|uniref:leucine-rich repeat-containing protein 72 n=1 Tax=Macrotis lagotis TaxID=92651 RepID=UPI003D6903B5